MAHHLRPPGEAVSPRTLHPAPTPAPLPAEPGHGTLRGRLQPEDGAAPATHRWLAAKPGLVRAQRLRSQQFIPLAANYTIANAFALEGSFDLVRLIYANDLTDATWTLDAAAVAASARLHDGVHPVDAAGNAVAWTQATCNSRGLDHAFSPLAGLARAMVVPAAPFPGGLGLAVTDWVALTSRERVDAESPLPLLFARSYTAHGGRFPAFGAGDFSSVAGWPAVDRGRVVRCHYQFGDHATAAGPPLDPVEDNHVVPIGVQYHQRVRGLSVMTLGDSLTAGFGTVANANSYGFQACAAVSTLAAPVSHVASGWSGQTAAAFIARGYDEFALFRPEIVVIETTSPNGDPRNAADFDRAFACALAFAAHVERHGAVPILKTAVPFDMDEEADGFRRGINERVRAMGATGQMLVLDADGVVARGDQPAAVHQRYRTADDAHLNDAGHAAIALALVPLLRRSMLGWW